MTAPSFTAFPDLASRALGGSVSAANDELSAHAAPATHLRLDVYPDGGLSRLSLFGDLDDAAVTEARRTWWEALPEGHRAQEADQRPV